MYIKKIFFPLGAEGGGSESIFLVLSYTNQQQSQKYMPNSTLITSTNMHVIDQILKELIVFKFHISSAQNNFDKLPQNYFIDFCLVK